MEPMTMALLMGGAAALGGGGGFLSSKSANKRLGGVADKLPAYSGYKPPSVSFLRPVEQQITDILMKRSQGQDVGFDPARREKLLENYKIETGRNYETNRADTLNQLSGSGLSSNLAARDALLGRLDREKNNNDTLYRNKVDIEDLSRRNEERDVNTGRLQSLNNFNFGQENTRASFDKSIWDSENQNELARRGLQMQSASSYQDPFAEALAGGANMAFSAANMAGGMGGMSKTAPTATAPDVSGVSQLKKGAYDQDIARILRTGKSLGAK
jgi:hypothetical protein